MAGTWTDVGFGTENTTAINFNSAAAAIETALEAVYGVGIATVSTDTDFTIAFNISEGDSNLAADFTLLANSTDPALTITQVYMENPLIGTNAGTKTCDCIITCDMTADSTAGLRVTLTETSEYLDLDRSLSNGEEVIFNTQTRMVTVDSSDARSDLDFNSTWFKLPVGTFTIQSDTTNTSMEIVYRQRWI